MANSEFHNEEATLSYVSKMHMHSQETPPEVITNELLLINDDLGPATEYNIAYDDEGWDSRVYLINGGQTVYKFPRSPEVMAGYGKEIATLRLLSSLHDEVATQRFLKIDSEGRYFSYNGLVGTQLSELLPSIDAAEKQRIGTTIGQFLGRLHALQPEDATVVTAHDEVEEYQAKFRLLSEVLPAKFSLEEQFQLAEFFFEVLPPEMARLGEAPAFCHGDLGSYNIIVNDDDGTVGIIDFGNAGYYDQSKDFIDFGDDTVLDAVLQAYGDSELIRAKTALRMLAQPIIDLVYYESKKDPVGAAETINRLRFTARSVPNNLRGGLHE